MSYEFDLKKLSQQTCQLTHSELADLRLKYGHANYLAYLTLYQKGRTILDKKFYTIRNLSTPNGRVSYEAIDISAIDAIGDEITFYRNTSTMKTRDNITDDGYFYNQASFVFETDDHDGELETHLTTRGKAQHQETIKLAQRLAKAYLVHFDEPTKAFFARESDFKNISTVPTQAAIIALIQAVTAFNVMTVRGDWVTQLIN